MFKYFLFIFPLFLLLPLGIASNTYVGINATTPNNLTLDISITANNSEINIDGVNVKNEFVKTKHSIYSHMSGLIGWYDFFKAFRPDIRLERLSNNQLQLRELFFNLFMPRNEIINHFYSIIEDIDKLWVQQRIIEKKVDLIANQLGYNITNLDKKATMMVMEEEGITKLTRNNITYYKRGGNGEFVEVR